MDLSVIVLQKDPAIAQSLAGGLHPHFRSVRVARSRGELRRTIAQGAPEVAVVDLEASDLAEVENLHRDFPGLLMVCTHRIPDEDLWMAALAAGAVDICPDDDPDAVLTAVLRSVAMARTTAA